MSNRDVTRVAKKTLSKILEFIDCHHAEECKNNAMLVCIIEEAILECGGNNE